MRLNRIQEFMTAKGMTYEYHEQDGLGSIDFVHRGLSYHIWEFFEGDEYGVESNVGNTGRTQDYLGDYEGAILEIIKYWA